MFEEDKPLPQFRKDLEYYPGPEEPDGSPTCNIYDPIRAKYFKVTWAEELIIKTFKPGMTLEELTNTINTETTLRVTSDDIKYFFIEALRHDLLGVFKPTEHHEKMAEMLNVGWFKWLLYHYLYVRIPILNPDAFLGRTLHYVRPLGSSYAFIIYISLALIGITLLFLRFTEFLHTFTYFFSLQGLLVYATTISCVKVVHEFSHAYTAKNYKVYVPSMGIALIVLWPVLYTDVTDGWKLKSRKQRLLISSAGIIAEMIIAGLCTIGWVMSEPGILQSLFFVIASITWISTLVINLNPAIRFDGYYMLGDIWGIENLQLRSFNLARWRLRDWFLGLTLPCPEPHMSTKRMTGMIIYAIYTWIYRIILYTGIAIFVYYKFTKALGLFLFFLEISVFLVWPLASEIQAMNKLRGKMTMNPRLIATLTVLGLLVGWFVIPLPHEETFHAISTSQNKQAVYIPFDSVIEKIYVERGQEINVGEPVVKLSSPAINAEIAKLQLQDKILENEIGQISLTDTDRPFIPQKRAERASNAEKLQGLINKRTELNIKAEVTGKVYYLDDTIREGEFLAKDRVIAKIADLQDIEVVAFIPEQDIKVVYKGQKAKFRIPSTNDIVNGTIISINPTRSSILIYPQLASIYNGPLAVSQEPNSRILRLVDTYYVVKVKLDKTDTQVRFGQTGEIEVAGPWRSKFGMLMKKILRVFWRESGI